MFSQQHIKGSTTVYSGVSLLENPYEWALIQACDQPCELYKKCYKSLYIEF